MMTWLYSTHGYEHKRWILFFLLLYFLVYFRMQTKNLKDKWGIERQAEQTPSLICQIESGPTSTVVVLHYSSIKMCIFYFNFFVFRQSGRNVMTPIDFDVRSNASRVSKVSKSSKGTSYKDMGGSRRGATNKGSSSYKNMNGAGQQNKGIKWAP